MSKWIGFFLLLSLTLGLTVFVSRVGAGPAKISSIEHSVTIVQRPDGRFDVTCLDGKTEVKSRDEVLGNRICTHLRTYSGTWRWNQGGFDGQQCNMEMNLVRSSTAIAQLQAKFSAPCASTPAVTQQCQALTCSLQLGGHFYSFDFSVSGRSSVTRLDDQTHAVYLGNAGPGASSRLSGATRLETLGGVDNVLQASIDNGVTWKSVCDDSFTSANAAVVCRELGFSGRSPSFQGGISVPGDADFGWDELYCQGNEQAIADCSHNPWGNHDCGETEHVQVNCDP